MRIVILLITIFMITLLILCMVIAIIAKKKNEENKTNMSQKEQFKKNDSQKMRMPLELQQPEDRTSLLTLIKGKKIWTTSEIKNIEITDQQYNNDNNENTQINIDNLAGVYLFYIEDELVNINEVFLPIYVDQTENIRKTWLEHSERIDKAYWSKNDEFDIRYRAIAHYLRNKHKTPAYLRFVILESYGRNYRGPLDNKTLRYWLDETGGWRGFNKIK